MNDCKSVLELISSVSTAIAAIAAAITTFQNHSANKQADKERHAMIKPIFLINSTFEDREEKIIKISIKNIGFDRIGKINVDWEGTKGVTAKIIRDTNLDSDYDYYTYLNLKDSNHNNGNIEGKINLVYYDVLGKKYCESVDAKIINKYYELTQEYNLELESGLVNKIFQ